MPSCPLAVWIPPVLDLFIQSANADLKRGREAAARWRAAHPEKAKASPEKARARYKAWAAANPARLKATALAWRERNRAHLNAWSRKWAAANPAARRRSNRAWRENNPELRKKIARVYSAKMYREDPNYRLARLARNRVFSAITRQKGVKSTLTTNLIGCTVEELKRHLEGQFKPGMTWENLGPVWHIDHRKPCALFDLTDLAQQRACFHFSNLQPLFAAENFKKWAHYEEAADVAA